MRWIITIVTRRSLGFSGCPTGRPGKTKLRSTNQHKCPPSSPYSVAGLYCKRPIQCLTSSEILTPHPLTAWRVCTPHAFGAGGEHTRWVESGWGGGGSITRKTPGTALYSIYVCKYFYALQSTIKKAQNFFYCDIIKDISWQDLNLFCMWKIRKSNN